MGVVACFFAVILFARFRKAGSEMDAVVSSLSSGLIHLIRAWQFRVDVICPKTVFMTLRYAKFNVFDWAVTIPDTVPSESGDELEELVIVIVIVTPQVTPSSDNIPNAWLCPSMITV